MPDLFLEDRFALAGSTELEQRTAQAQQIGLLPGNSRCAQAATVEVDQVQLVRGYQYIVRIQVGVPDTGAMKTCDQRTGLLGHFAVQFAKCAGATVLTTVSGNDLDFVRRLGADQAIDYKTQRFEDVARDIDLVFDLVAGKTQDRSWAVLKPGGMLVSTLGQPPEDKAAAHQAHASGYMAQPNAAELTKIAQLIDSGKVRPVIEATFAFADAPQAEQRQEEGHVHGKIVLELAA